MGKTVLKITIKVPSLISIRAELGKSLHKTRKYLRENPEAYLIVAAELLLINAAITLAYGNEPLANQLATCAYYMLVLGIILQIIFLIESGKENSQ